eukprot:CAMPEP_0197413824 /NCGR_PEP_ID=MMETSP1170-20131217/642_1 /TAXON_ID=54406 /ORGANISM="Sarcinochrysis sp, Strain CCMP770" /LENGTH=83 /DNA_ID=CAMNT_0042940467 /DNA_START=281 /DNA_END=532 /DNA_ORIENTATION=+
MSTAEELEELRGILGDVGVNFVVVLELCLERRTALKLFYWRKPITLAVAKHVSVQPTRDRHVQRRYSNQVLKRQLKNFLFAEP